jgi:hypothetical protein
MRIAVLGAGNVGGTLGRRWIRAGHDVTFFDPDPGGPNVRALHDGRPEAFAVTAARAAASADVVLLAMPWTAAEDAIRSAGDLTGKVLLDSINPIDSQFANLAVGHTTSAAEMIAGWAPGARVVKIFNVVGFNIMAEPDFHGRKPAMLYCGDDPDAKRVAADLAAELEFDPVDAGPLAQARQLEAMGWLVTTMVVKYGHGPNIAFALLRR